MWAYSLAHIRFCGLQANAMHSMCTRCASDAVRHRCANEMMMMMIIIIVATHANEIA